MIDHIPQGQELTDWVNNHSKQRRNELTGLKYGGEYYENELHEAIDEYSKFDLPSDVKSKAIEVIAHGSLEGHSIGLDDVKRNGYAEVHERRYIADMICSGGEKMEAAEAITETGVCGFHATRSTALAGILEAGAMRSAEKLNREGALMVTGEHMYQKIDGQPNMSFSDLGSTADVISQYAGGMLVKRYSIEEVVATQNARLKQIEEDISAPSELSQNVSSYFTDRLRNAYEQEKRALEYIINNPHSLFAALSRVNFPVVFGISGEAVLRREDERTKGHLLKGASDLGEFRPNGDEIPIDDLPVIAVPREVVAPVKELFVRFGYENQRVIAIEALAA